MIALKNLSKRIYPLLFLIFSYLHICTIYISVYSSFFFEVESFIIFYDNVGKKTGWFHVMGSDGSCCGGRHGNSTPRRRRPAAVVSPTTSPLQNPPNPTGIMWFILDLINIQLSCQGLLWGSNAFGRQPRGERPSTRHAQSWSSHPRFFFFFFTNVYRFS